jgi:CSLREA domain-containing protein
MNKKWIHNIFVGLLLIGIAGCNLSSSEPIPHAVPNIDIDRALVVDTFRDTFDGDCTGKDCSLRDAVFIANTTPKNTIYLPKGLYILNEQTLINDDTGRYGDLDISSFVTIQGDGVGLTTIDGANNDRIFHILKNGGNLTQYDMALMGGSGDHASGLSGDMPSGGLIADGIETIGCAVSSLWGGCDNGGTITNVVPDDYEQLQWQKGGGAIANNGILLLQNVDIAYNVAQFGGAIYNTGSASITGGEICNNQGRYGGGIYNVGNLEINGTNICNNNSNSLIPEIWGPSEIWLNTRFELLDWNTWAPEFDSDLLLLGGGGGIYNTPSGSIDLDNSLISENNTHYKIGTGILNRGYISFSDSQVIDNFGDAILNFGRVDIAGSEIGLSVISGNDGSALVNIGEANIFRTLIYENLPYGSGPIAGYADSVTTIDQSAIFDNQSNVGAGAIAIKGGEFALTNVSIGRNISGPSNGAIYSEAGFAWIINVTIFDNYSPGIHQQNGTLFLVNTIIADNEGGNCTGTIESRGHNYDSGNSCNLSAEGDISNLDSSIINTLDASTKYTYKINGNSPAHDNGEAENCPPVDQQGEDRPMGFRCDIGADEIKEINGVPIIVPEGLLPEVPDAGEVVVDPDIPPVTADQNANCRAGPGTVYNEIGFMAEGDTATVLGQNAGHTWVYVLLLNLRECWVFEGAFTEDSVFEYAEVLPDPPLPPTPISTTPPVVIETDTPAPLPLNGSISGTVFKDANGDGNSSGDDGFGGVTVRLGAGACSSTGLDNANTSGNGGFSFSGLSAGTYCLSVVTPSAGSCPRWDHPSTSTSFTINLSAGQTDSKNIGFDNSACSVD